MRETSNAMYSCPRQKYETKYVRMTTDSVNDSYDENDANSPPRSIVAHTEPTERKPNQTKRSKDAQLRATSLFPEMLRIKNLLRAIVRTSCSKTCGILKKNWKHEGH